MSPQDQNELNRTRRQFLAYFSGLGLASTLLPGVLWSQVQKREGQKITKEMLKEAEQIAGLNFSDAQWFDLLNLIPSLSWNKLIFLIFRNSNQES